MSKFKQREMPWHHILEHDSCIDAMIHQDKELNELRQRVEKLEMALRDASFRDWAESYDSWYCSQINYDLVREYERAF